MSEVKVVKVGEIKSITPNKHYDLFARGLYTGKNVAVGRVWMSAYGGAEIHEHDGEHVFYILRGGAKMFDGKETYYVEEGDCIIVEPGVPHSFTGNGKVDCEYIVVSAPPPTFN